MKGLITGCSGFIGFHKSNYFLKKNWKVLGIDNNNNYYHKQLKLDRLNILKQSKNFSFVSYDLSKNSLENNKIIFDFKPTYLIHLAAQPGVRFSIINPKKNFDYNIKAFFNVLELAQKIKVKHFMFASSSSVYGNQQRKMSEELPTDNPVSFYAATKKQMKLWLTPIVRFINLTVLD